MLRIIIRFAHGSLRLFWLKPGNSKAVIIRYAHSQQAALGWLARVTAGSRAAIVSVSCTWSEPSVPRVCVRVTADSGIITPFRGLYSLGGISK